MQPTFRHVHYRWDDATAAKLDPVGRLIYRSNVLGSDQRITNTGGGNTSAKITEKDPLTGAPVEVLWLKGSGGDLRTLRQLARCAAARGAWHVVPRSSPADENQAALRRVESASGRRRCAEEQAPARSDGLSRGLRGVLQPLQAPELARDARPEPDGHFDPRPRQNSRARSTSSSAPAAASARKPRIASSRKTRTSSASI